MAAPLISLHSITKEFPGVRALSQVCFDVFAGELHALCGENGAGKSTLMKILSGVIPDYEGELRIDGKVVQFQGTRDAEKSGISIIHQELNLVEQLSVAANIFLGREQRSFLGLRDDRTMVQTAKALLSELECDVDPQSLASSLRVGDQQLVEIAKALSLESRILIMDEPTSALTENEVARLYRVIERLRKRGTTILYISHKMDEVFDLSDRITVLRDGSVIKTLDTSDTSPSEITQLMVGREIELMEPKKPTSCGETLLEVEGLSLAWPGHARGYRLKDISFSLKRGEVLGVAGLMGAGRTELLEAIFGASTDLRQGTIRIKGKAFRADHPDEACRAGIALVTEDRKRLGLFSAQNVGQNISTCSLRDFSRFGVLLPSRERKACASMIEKLKIKAAGLSASITSLSGGNQQKCIVARWLLTSPSILLLDDPTRGVDVGAKAELYRIIQSLCEEGLGVIVTSSELPELLALSDRILVLSEGRLTRTFNRSEATQQAILEAATLGWQQRSN